MLRFEPGYGFGGQREGRGSILKKRRGWAPPHLRPCTVSSEGAFLSALNRAEEVTLQPQRVRGVQVLKSIYPDIVTPSVGDLLPAYQGPDFGTEDFPG